MSAGRGSKGKARDAGAPRSTAWEVRFYATPAGRCPAQEFLEDLGDTDAAAILADIRAYAKDGDRAAVSWKWIKGQTPMKELRTGGFRTLFVLHDAAMWVLDICRKDEQERAIERAAARMRAVKGE